MQRFTKFVHRFTRDESGATAIEYGLIAALIAIAIVSSLRALGSGNSASWMSTANTAVNAMQGG